MSKPPAILLNDDFYSKGRNIRWIRENGGDGVMILQCVWIASSKERDCRIAKADTPYIPFLSTYPSEKILQVLESAVAVGLLNGDDTHYWNSQVAENTESFQRRQKNYSEAAKAREAAKRKQDSATILAESSQNLLNINNKSKVKSKSKSDPVWDEKIGKMVRVIR